MRTHVTANTKPQKHIPAPDWVRSLVCQDPDDPESFSAPDCTMITPVDPRSSLMLREKTGCYKLDPSQKLSVILRNKSFVEFPTIEIWEEFRGTIVDAQGDIIHYAEEESPLKRRKLNPKAGRKAIRGLVGGYGSGDEGKTEERDVLSMLGGYAESDGDDVVVESDPEEHSIGENHGDEEENIDSDLGSATLLQAMQQVREGEEWIGSPREDQVDWRGSDKEGPGWADVPQ
jgi:hypothetical protein